MRGKCGPINAPPRRNTRAAFSGCSHGGSRRQKRPDFRQQFLKAFAGAAGAGVFSAKLFEQFLVAMNDPHAAFDVRLGRVAAPALTGALESRAGRAGVTGFAWDTSGGELHDGTWPTNSATIVTCASRRKGTSRISPHGGSSADVASFSEPSFPSVSLTRIFWMSPSGCPLSWILVTNIWLPFARRVYRISSQLGCVRILHLPAD